VQKVCRTDDYPCSSHESRDGGGARRVFRGDRDAKAEEIYKQKCIVCHAADGNSPLPNMSFADGVWKHGSSVKEVVKTINDGVPGTAMMPFKGQFSAQEIQALARYVRKFDPKLAASTTKTKAPTKKPAA
jgi:mono/diheme cytochrome c family protein